MAFKTPRGTRDFAPQEMARRRGLEAHLRRVFASFGYQEVQTPTFESLELFTAKSGEGIVSELYDFQDKGGRDLTLRPELTAPVMRMYFQDHAFDPKPLKWFYFGNCFRYDRPQAGRYREFWQFGCEQIGAGGPLAYAELIALAAALPRAVGLQGVRLAVGHVGVLRRLVDALGLDSEARSALMRAIDKGDTEGMEKLLAAADDGAERLQRVLGGDVEAARTPANDRGDAELDALLAVMDHLADFGVEAEMDIGIARGLDYYTDIVFEAHCDGLGAQSQILGGGGYDLSHVFAGQETPTLGFGLGFDRLLEAAEAQGGNLPEGPAPLAYLGGMGKGTGEAVRLATHLRDHDLIVHLDLMGRKPGAIAKAADAAGARFMVVIGERDLEAGVVEVKHMADGVRHEVAIDALAAWFENEGGGLDLREYN